MCPCNALQQTQEHEFIGGSRQDFIRQKEELRMNTVYVEDKKEINENSQQECEE
jgi:formate hydrogenlyase subunit 6/NADH:ubiquinone oxidoreductase subunit I